MHESRDMPSVDFLTRKCMHSCVCLCACAMRPQEREILEAEHENAEASAQRESELGKLRQSERLRFFTCFASFCVHSVSQVPLFLVIPVLFEYMHVSVYVFAVVCARMSGRADGLM